MPNWVAQLAKSRGEERCMHLHVELTRMCCCLPLNTKRSPYVIEPSGVRSTPWFHADDDIRDSKDILVAELEKTSNLSRLSENGRTAKRHSPRQTELVSRSMKVFSSLSGILHEAIEPGLE